MDAPKIRRRTIPAAVAAAQHFAANENTPEVERPDLRGAANAGRAAAAAAMLATATVPTAPAEAGRFTQAEIAHDRDVLQSLFNDIERSKRHAYASEPGAVTQEDLSCLARNVFHEAQGENFQGQVAVAMVTIARALDKRWSNDICGVVYQKSQFSWTLEKRFLQQKPSPTLQQIHDHFAALIAGKRLVEARELLAILAGFNTDKVYYYKRTDWDENNPEEKRMSARSKQRWQKLKKIPLPHPSAHTFYTD